MTRRSRGSRARGGDATRIVFLGGLGEIGRNMTVFEHDGQILIVDAGLMFPTEDMLGVDLVLPDFGYVRDRADDVVGLLLTHGHEDHIGGVPFLLRDISPPIYGARLTLGLLRPKLDEHGLLDEADLHEIESGVPFTIGPFEICGFNVAHSIPDAFSTFINTPNGRVFHTGDFKVDRNDERVLVSDLSALQKEAEKGVDLMLADSTNADHPGFTVSDSVVGKALEEVIVKAPGRVIVACFASNIHRVGQIIDAAVRNGRMVALLGRSMVTNSGVARELGYLTYEDDDVIPIEDLDRFPPERIVIVSTGSQGEPLSALSRMAARDHKWVTLNRNDTVVLSATPIPGNESAVRRVTDGLFRIGCEVIQPPEYAVHASGHASAEDLKMMAQTIAPRWFVPVHGEYRHLRLHQRLAMQSGIDESRTFVVEDGDVLELRDGDVRVGQRVHAGYVLVDGLGIGDVSEAVLRDRRLLASDGIIVAVVTIDSQTGELLAGPDLISRGFLLEEEADDFLEDARAEIRDSLASLAEDEVTDWTQIRRAVRRSLGRYVHNETGRRPIVLPVVMEV